MIQRIFEAIAGVLAAVTGLWLLFSVESAFFPTTPAQSYGVSGQPALPLAWIPAFQVFTIALVGIALGALLHGVPSITRMGRGMRRLLVWGGRLALWLSALALIVMAYLAWASIGLLFIPSIALAVIACALALIPASTPAPPTARPLAPPRPVGEGAEG